MLYKWLAVNVYIGERGMFHSKVPLPLPLLVNCLVMADHGVLLLGQFLVMLLKSPYQLMLMMLVTQPLLTPQFVLLVTFLSRLEVGLIHKPLAPQVLWLKVMIANVGVQEILVFLEEPQILL